MENDKNKKDLFYKLLIAVAIVIPLIIGFSYAYIMASISGNENPTHMNGTAVTSMDFRMTTANNGYIDASELVPIESSQIAESAPKGEFSVILGQSVYNVSYSIILTNINISSELKISDFKWKLVCTSCSTTDKDATGDFSGLTENEMVLNSGLILEPNSTDTYTLYIYLAENGADQTSLLNKTFGAKVKSSAEYVISN